MTTIFGNGSYSSGITDLYYYKDIDSNGCPAKMIRKTSQGNMDMECVYDIVWKKL